jgi:hypothetical protein
MAFDLEKIVPGDRIDPDRQKEHLKTNRIDGETSGVVAPTVAFRMTHGEVVVENESSGVGLGRGES